jgi:hypothetical protein
MQAECCSEALVLIYQFTRRHIPEDHNFVIPHRENMKSWFSLSSFMVETASLGLSQGIQNLDAT